MGSEARRRIPAKAAWALLLVALAACGGDPKGDAGDARGESGEVASRGTIGFSAMTLRNPFFKIIADTMAEEAARHGFDVVVTDAERDVNRQSQQVDNFLASGVVAIVLNPVDRIAIGPAVRRANEAGVPVFTSDLQAVAEGVEIAGHVGTDNYQGGLLAGEAMIEALGEAGGKVLILHFKQANSCVLRVDGFRQAIEEHNRDLAEGRIEIVAELEGGGLRDEGYRAMADGIQAHPDLAGVFAINDPSALGARTALEQAGRADQVRIVGFDGELAGRQAIREGKIYADPIQYPDRMGAITVQNIVRYLDGEDFERVHLIPTELYRRADAEQDPTLAG